MSNFQTEKIIRNRIFFARLSLNQLTCMASQGFVLLKMAFIINFTHVSQYFTYLSKYLMLRS